SEIFAYEGMPHEQTRHPPKVVADFLKTSSDASPLSEEQQRVLSRAFQRASRLTPYKAEGVWQMASPQSLSPLLEDIREGKPVIIPSGYNGRDASHQIAVVFLKKEQQTYMAICDPDNDEE